MIRRETWIILGLFALALGGLFWWQRYGREATVDETPVAETKDQFLFDLGDASIQSVRLERVGDRVVELEKDAQGVWQIAWPAGVQIDSAALESTLSQLSGVSVVEKMAAAPSLETMGLNPPLHRLLLTLDDGSQLIANVGNGTPTGSGYYVLANQAVYVVNKYSLDPILGLIDNLPLQPTPTSGAAYPNPEMTPAVGEPGDLTPTPAGTP